MSASPTAPAGTPRRILQKQKQDNLKRLEAQRNELNTKVRMLREEVGLLQEPGSYVGEVVKLMGKKKALVKIHPEVRTPVAC